MRRTFLVLFVLVVIGIVVFLLLSKSGFLGDNLGKQGQELSGTLENVFKQSKDAISELVGTKEEPKPQAPKEDPKITKFFQQLKTATPETLGEMVVQGFSPTKPNLAGEPPIVYMARYNDNLAVYELMLNIGASVEQTNKKGDNALKVAIERGAPLEIIRLLYANQTALDEKARQEKIKQGPGAKVITSYYPSIENGGVKR